MGQIVHGSIALFKYLRDTEGVKFRVIQLSKNNTLIKSLFNENALLVPIYETKIMDNHKGLFPMLMFSDRPIIFKSSNTEAKRGFWFSTIDPDFIIEILEGNFKDDNSNNNGGKAPIDNNHGCNTKGEMGRSPSVRKIQEVNRAAEGSNS